MQNFWEVLDGAWDVNARLPADAEGGDAGEEGASEGGDLFLDGYEETVMVEPTPEEEPNVVVTEEEEPVFPDSQPVFPDSQPLFPDSQPDEEPDSQPNEEPMVGDSQPDMQDLWFPALVHQLKTNPAGSPKPNVVEPGTVEAGKADKSAVFGKPDESRQQKEAKIKALRCRVPNLFPPQFKCNWSNCATVCICFRPTFLSILLYDTVWHYCA